VRKINPYTYLDETKFWNKYISNRFLGEVLATEGLKKFTILAESKVMTMGSCFAQHVSNFLKTQGNNFYVSELNLGNKTANLVDSKNGYGIFTARYGNIYNLKQANQLLQNAISQDIEFGEIWSENNGHENIYIDSIRPSAIPNGFATYDKVLEDRKFHYEKVIEAINHSDVLILTLGLTEGWLNIDSGQIYQIAPGVKYGEFKKNEHQPFNLDIFECISELERFIFEVTKLKKKIKIILTVSPIPLAATHQNENILIASSLSKYKLRTAIGELEKKYENVFYFPSFELITILNQAGNYFESNLRDLKVFAIRNVMRIFQKTYFIESEHYKWNTETITNLQNQNTNVLCDDDLILNKDE
jgi:hypothetical protein